MFLFQIQTGNYLVLEFTKEISPLLFLFLHKGGLGLQNVTQIFLSGYYFEVFEYGSEICLPFASQGFSFEKKVCSYKVAYLSQNL